jgi:hypothetical protein
VNALPISPRDVMLAKKLGVSPQAVARHFMERVTPETRQIPLETWRALIPEHIRMVIGDVGSAEPRGILHESHPSARCEPPPAPPKEGK